MQNVESDREDDQNDQANNRPFFHLRFDRFPFVFAEEGFAGSAERVDTRRVALLKQYENDRRERRNEHQQNHDAA